MVGYGVGLRVAGRLEFEPDPLFDRENGTGLGECARSTQPPRNATMLMIPNQMRRPIFKIFILICANLRL